MYIKAFHLVDSSIVMVTLIQHTSTYMLTQGNVTWFNSYYIFIFQKGSFFSRTHVPIL